MRIYVNRFDLSSLGMENKCENILLFHTNFHIFITTDYFIVNQMWMSVQTAKQTIVTQTLCVRTLKGRTFADAKKDMLEVVKFVQVRKVYDFKIFRSKSRIMICYLAIAIAIAIALEAYPKVIFIFALNSNDNNKDVFILFRY